MLYHSAMFQHFAGQLLPMCWCLPRVELNEHGMIIVHRRRIEGGL